VSADSLIARELVAEMIGEIYAGTLAWDPNRILLATHIKLNQWADREFGREP